MIKDDVIEFFNEFHESILYIRCLNSTSLVLLSKGMTNIKDFKPINLVGSVYELIAKVLAR